jgi:4,5-dihydroxyphthalate decarboxylase
MSKLSLSLATTPYDHVSDLTSGRIDVEGIDLTCLHLQTEEVFFRTVVYGDFDISEISMAKYAARRSQGDESLVAIPVFPSRVPRHSAIYVRRNGPVTTPADLVGRRVGLPEWAETALVYVRGFLAHDYGIDLASIAWVQAGVNEPGRTEKVKLQLPPGVTIAAMPDKSLNDMLLSGEVDAIMCARPPQAFAVEGGGPIRRLFEDFLDVESRHVRETGIFPIMHTVVIRGVILEKHPWVAMNLYKAFDEAKRRSVARILSATASAVPIPWCYERARRDMDVFGGEYWPYGIEPNRRTLDAFLHYAHEQGVCHRRMAPEELFAHQVQQRFRV